MTAINCLRAASFCTSIALVAAPRVMDVPDYGWFACGWTGALACYFALRGQ